MPVTQLHRSPWDQHTQHKHKAEHLPAPLGSRERPGGGIEGLWCNHSSRAPSHHPLAEGLSRDQLPSPGAGQKEFQ